jgi:hypothetical protein
MALALICQLVFLGSPKSGDELLGAKNELTVCVGAEVSGGDDALERPGTESGGGMRLETEEDAEAVVGTESKWDRGRVSPCANLGAG